MSNVKVLTDATGQEILSALGTANRHLETLAAKAELEMMSGEAEDVTFELIQKVVHAGYAEDIWPVGTVLADTWYDSVKDTSYSDPLIVVAYQYVELENGETVPGMILQRKYATRYTMPFDNYEAFYYAESALAAGTYYITVGSTAASNNWVSGDTWQFTLTEAVPAGGFLAGFRAHRESGKDISSLSVYSYDSDYNLIEEVSVSSGSSGTSLGEILLVDGDLNADQEVGYGSNRWMTSAYRQYLNSDADAGEWWEPQETYDLPPDQAASYPGYMSGVSDDLKAVIKKVKVSTATNTVTFDGSFDDTYDYFFLPALEQLYINPQIEGEGDYWQYWKEAIGLSDPETTGSTNEDRITYAVNSTSSAQTVRLRSASRGGAGGVWAVNSSGCIYDYGAYYAFRCAPACVIC